MEERREMEQRRVDRFAEGLKAAGVKLTHQRLEIFREVANSPDHPDAEAIFRGVRKRIPMISLDTVYRALRSLAELGFLDIVGHSHERARFDANMGPHHHFVCVRCGAMRDFRDEELDRLEIPEAVRSYGSPEKIQVEIQGVCNECSSRTNQKQCAQRRKETGWKRKRS